MPKLLDLNSQKDLDTAINLLNSERILAFPTETVYGIGGSIESKLAVQAIYNLKQREAKKPLSAHISSLNMVENIICDPPEIFFKLAEYFMPGPIALIVNKNKKYVPDFITSGLDTISIRFPSDSNCLKLISEYGTAIAASSANLSGKPAICSSDEMIDNEFLNISEIPAIVIGESKYKQESTIVSLIGDSPKILREGIIKKELIIKFINDNI